MLFPPACKFRPAWGPDFGLCHTAGVEEGTRSELCPGCLGQLDPHPQPSPSEIQMKRLWSVLLPGLHAPPGLPHAGPWPVPDLSHPCFPASSQVQFLRNAREGGAPGPRAVSPRRSFIQCQRPPPQPAWRGYSLARRSRDLVPTQPTHPPQVKLLQRRRCSSLVLYSPPSKLSPLNRAWVLEATPWVRFVFRYALHFFATARVCFS